MKTTKKVADYVKEKGISTMKISKATGINHQILYNCFDKNTTRQLKADELIKVCSFLGLDLNNLV